MELTTLLSSIALFYGAIYFIDLFLKSCMNLPYIFFLENLGIRIQPFRLHIFSTVFNRPLKKLAVINEKFLNLWFSIGAVLIIVLLVPVIGIMISNLLSQFHPKHSHSNQQILVPVVPGLNLPVDEFFFYFFTLFAVSIIHEIGHAVAAIGEDVKVNGIGFMFLYALPAAYVDIPADNIGSISPFRQLKIVCAGVWHNIVLALLAFAIGITLPTTLSTLYKIDGGVFVVNIDKGSPAFGQNGLLNGDVIDSINYCSVPNIDRWRECLLNISRTDQIGFCIQEDIVHSHDETVQHPFAHLDGSVECCDHVSGSGLCFELLENNLVDKGEARMLPYSCLPPRIALTSSSRVCRSSSECADQETFCLGPSIRNSTRLIKIVRNTNRLETKKEVLYLGSPGLLYTTIKVSNYIPKYSYVPGSLPPFLETLLDYVVKFSGALAILNMVPCVYLDGYWISGALVDLLCGSYVDWFLRRIIHIFITVFGTTLIVLNVIFGLKSLL